MARMIVRILIAVLAAAMSLAGLVCAFLVFAAMSAAREQCPDGNGCFDAISAACAGVVLAMVAFALAAICWSVARSGSNFLHGIGRRAMLKSLAAILCAGGAVTAGAGWQAWQAGQASQAGDFETLIRWALAQALACLVAAAILWRARRSMSDAATGSASVEGKRPSS